MTKDFIHKVKIYYEDTDSGGVVYYANYLKFLERARSEIIYSLGLTNKKLLTDHNTLIIVSIQNIAGIKIIILRFLVIMVLLYLLLLCL